MKFSPARLSLNLPEKRNIKIIENNIRLKSKSFKIVNISIYRCKIDLLRK